MREERLDAREAAALAQALLEPSDPQVLTRIIAEHVQPKSTEARLEIVAAFENIFGRHLYSDLATARTSAERVLLLAEQLADSAIRARGLRLAGVVAAAGNAQYQQSLEHFAEAAALHETLDDPLGLAKLEVSRVGVLGRVDQLHEAKLRHAEAARTLRMHERWELLGTLHDNLAMGCIQARDYSAALNLLDEAEEAYSAVGDVADRKRLLCQLRRALCLSETGDYREALALGDRVIDTADKLGIHDLAASQRINSASILISLGNYTQALAMLDTVIHHARKNDNRRLATEAALTRSDCMILLRQYPEALRICEELAPILEMQGAPTQAAQAHYNYGLALAGLNRLPEARSALAMAREEFGRVGARYWSAAADWAEATIALKQGHHNEAFELSRRCARQFEATQGSDALEAYFARTTMARAAIVAKRDDLAKGLVEQIKRDAQRIDSPSWRFLSTTLEAEFEFERGNHEAAIGLLEESIHHLDSLHGLVAIDLRSDFLIDKDHVYERLVQLLCERGDDSRALAYLERAKSRALLDKISLSRQPAVFSRQAEDSPLLEELQSLLASRDAAIFALRRTHGEDRRESSGTIRELDRELAALEDRIASTWHQLVVRNAQYARDAATWQTTYAGRRPPTLAEGAVLVEFYCSLGTWRAFLFDGSDIHRRDLGIRNSDLQRILTRLMLIRSSFVSAPAAQLPGLMRSSQQELRTLHDALLAPLSDLLERASAIAFVPHGLLHHVPFAALWDGTQYVVQRWESTTLPGADFASFLADRCPPTARVRAFGYGSADRLPAIEREAQSIAELWGGERLHVAKATKPALISALSTTDIVHVASHASLHPDHPSLSGLELADGWLTVLDLLQVQVRSPLVILSACNTASGRISGGDEVQSLAHAFLGAGAGALLATLWPVDDEISAGFLLDVHRELKDRSSFAGALRNAQLQCIERDAEDRSCQPMAWAAYRLFGIPTGSQALS